jgi:hypothetical protein
MAFLSTPIPSAPFGETPASAGALASDPATWDTTLPQLRQFIRQQFGRDLPLAVSELNTNSGRIVPPASLAAVWWADTLGRLMSNQVEYAAYFSTEGVDIPYPLFTRRGLQETAMLRATQLVARLQQNFVPLQAALGSSVSTYVTQDQGHKTVGVLVINKTARGQRISVQNTGLLPFGPWQNAALTLPAYGMAVLNLRQGGGDEAFSFSNSEEAQQLAPGIRHLTCGSNAGATLAC